jgi:hypothetical protein
MYVLRNESGDVVSKPFRATRGYEAPEGLEHTWAETLLGRSAVALVAARLREHKPEGMSQKQLVYGIVDSARRVLLGNEWADRHSPEYIQRFSGPLYAAANAVVAGGKPNARRSFKLNGAHWGLGYRIFQLTSAFLGIDTEGETVLTQERVQAKLAALLNGTGELDTEPVA